MVGKLSIVFPNDLFLDKDGDVNGYADFPTPREDLGRQFKSALVVVAVVAAVKVYIMYPSESFEIAGFLDESSMQPSQMVLKSPISRNGCLEDPRIIPIRWRDTGHTILLPMCSIGFNTQGLCNGIEIRNGAKDLQAGKIFPISLNGFFSH